MIFIFFTLFGSVLGSNPGVYPVQREDYVWNGEPMAAPYQAYPPRPTNVYRVIRQEFRPLPYVGFHVPPGPPQTEGWYPPPGPPQTEGWYPPMINGYEHQTYQLSPRIPAPISGNGYLPQLFVPVSNQVFPSPKIPNLNNGQSSSRRPILQYPSETTSEDDSVLSATRKFSIDEGKPLPPVSEYLNSINKRPIKTYISFNDEVEINAEQKDLLEAKKTPYMDTIEPVSQVDRFRRQVMHIIEVPMEEVVESKTVDSSTSDFDGDEVSPDFTERLLTFKDLWYHQAGWDPKFSDKNEGKYFPPAHSEDEYFPPAPHNEDEFSIHLEEEDEEVITEESLRDINPTEVNSAEIMSSIIGIAMRKHTPPVFIPVPTLNHLPAWEYETRSLNKEDHGAIDADTFEGNEEIAVDSFGHTERADPEELFQALFGSFKFPMAEETEMAVTKNLYGSNEEVANTPKEVITTTNDDESSDREELEILSETTTLSKEASITARPTETTIAATEKTPNEEETSIDATEITPNEDKEEMRSISDTITNTPESTTTMESFTDAIHPPNVVEFDYSFYPIQEEEPSEDEVVERVEMDFLDDEAKNIFTQIVPDIPIDEVEK